VFSIIHLFPFFEVDRHYIVLTAIRALTTDGKMEKDAILKVIKKYNIDPDKTSPVKV
jgi:pyruvate dehydrogenase E1 component